MLLPFWLRTLTLALCALAATLPAQDEGRALAAENGGEFKQF